MRFRTGIVILRESWNVLRQDAELIWFPVMSSLASVVIVALIIATGFLIPSIGDWVLSLLADSSSDAMISLGPVLALAICFCVYYLLHFVVIYFNTALVSCVLMRFEGGDPTVMDGIRMANARIPQILAWTLLSAGVGTILSAIEQRLGSVGSIIMKLIGVAWTVAVYFVIPVIAAEGLGPIDAVKRSAQLLRKSWGEGLVGNIGLGVVTGIAFLCLMAFAALALWGFSVLGSTFLIVTTLALIVVGTLVLSILSSTLGQIFLAGLYRYATTGNVAMGFTAESFQGAFKKK
ncbi:MAG: hypothetical protein IPH49_11045 [Ignavibacteria bacterium]|nr:hypothetical protein [Ignavibacteria bacterium]